MRHARKPKRARPKREAWPDEATPLLAQTLAEVVEDFPQDAFVADAAVHLGEPDFRSSVRRVCAALEDHLPDPYPEAAVVVGQVAAALQAPQSLPEDAPEPAPPPAPGKNDLPSENADAPSEDARRPAEKADDPSDKAQRPDDGADTPSDEGIPPSLEGNSVSHEGDTVSHEANRPAEDAERPPEDTVDRDPGENIPREKADDPAESAERPPEGDMDPAAGEAHPSQKATDPAEGDTLLSSQAIDPGAEATLPSQESIDPAEDVNVPAQEATQLAERADRPDEKAIDPDEKRGDPSEKADVPAQEATQLAERADRPDEKATDPDEKAIDPDEKAIDPDEKAIDPDEKATDPDEKRGDPSEKATDPDEKATDPDEKATDPDEKRGDPSEKAIGPDKNTHLPAENAIDRAETDDGTKDEAAAEAVVGPRPEVRAAGEVLLQYVATHGLNHFDLSMKLLADLATRFEVTSTVRSFVDADRRRALRKIEGWCRHEHPRVRLTAADALRSLAAPSTRYSSQPTPDDPRSQLQLLEHLKDDPAPAVRRTVARTLGELARRHPETVAQHVRRWRRGASPARHAVITQVGEQLLRLGRSEAFDILGATPDPRVKARVFVRNRRLQPGQNLEIKVELSSRSRRPQTLVLEYALGDRRPGREPRWRAYRLETLELQPGEHTTVYGTHRIAPHGHGSLGQGRVELEVRVCGKAMASSHFEMRAPPRRHRGYR